MVIKYADNIFSLIYSITKSEKLHGPPLIYRIVSLSNGKYLPISEDISMFYAYRGEDDDYDSKYSVLLPSIYRGKDRKNIDILADRIKIKEFELILHTHPKVKKLISYNYDVRFNHLAQHYGLNTDLIDVTSNIGIAAFFATNSFCPLNNSFKPKGNGVGCLRVTMQPLIGVTHKTLTEAEDQYIGAQPFERPMLQQAQVIKINSRGDMQGRTFTSKYFFKQELNQSKILNKIFYKNHCIFPKEITSYIAKLIKTSNTISFEAMEEFCKFKNLDLKKIMQIFEKSEKYSIRNNFVYIFSNEEVNLFSEKIEKTLFGENIQLRTRLMR